MIDLAIALFWWALPIVAGVFLGILIATLFPDLEFRGELFAMRLRNASLKGEVDDLKAKLARLRKSRKRSKR